jgi:sugar phosphate isomerase/epimerase
MIRGESALHTLDEFSPREIGHTREKFNKHGLEVVCISTGVRFTSLDPEEFRKQQDLTKLNVDIAAGLGARFIRVFGGPIPEDQDREETFKRIREGLAYAAQVGESRGVRVLLETHDSFSTSRQICELLGDANIENLGFLWDLLHPYRHGETFAETFKALGPWIRHVHVKDSANFSEDGFDLTLVGEGSLPIGEAVELLQSGGYQGYLSLEWEKAWHPEIEDAEVAFPLYVNVMKEYLAR